MERTPSKFIAMLRDYPRKAKKQFLDAIKDGPANTVVADRIGCPRRSLYRVLEDEPELREALVAAQNKARLEKAKR